MEDWSNEMMKEGGEGRGTMTEGRGPVLDAQTMALVQSLKASRPARHTLALGSEGNTLVTCDFVAVFG